MVGKLESNLLISIVIVAANGETRQQPCIQCCLNLSESIEKERNERIEKMMIRFR